MSKKYHVISFWDTIVINYNFVINVVINLLKMTSNIKKAGFRCAIMNCDNYSRHDAYPYHRFPLDEERYVNKLKKNYLKNVNKIILINYKYKIKPVNALFDKPNNICYNIIIYYNLLYTF